MVRMAEDGDVGMKIFQGALGMARVQREGLGDLFVDDNVNPHASLGGCLKHAINTVLFVLRRWSSKIEFW
jgi:hypothetical protein